MSERNNSRAPLYAVLVLLIAAIAYIAYLQSTPNNPNSLSPKELREVEQMLSDKDHMLAEFESLSSRTEDEIVGLDDDASQRLGTELLQTIELYKAQLELIRAIENFEDSTQIKEAVKQLDLAKKGLLHSQKLFEKNQRVIEQLSQVKRYENRIDSLKEKVAALASLQKEDPRIASLQREIRRYEGKIQELLTNEKTYGRINDSLNTALSTVGDANRALMDSLKLQRSMYQELVAKAAKDAKLASKITLWYFEKDKMNKAKRRLLTDIESDYNRGSDIKSIYGVFTLSQFDFKPFEIATVYLSKSGTEIARVKVSVRDQISGEFSLLPSEKLNKGDYDVSVEYDQKTILKTSFHVSQ